MEIAINNHPMRLAGCRTAIRAPTLLIARVGTNPATDELLGRKSLGTPRQSTPKMRKASRATSTIATNQIASDGRFGLLPEFIPAGRIFAGAAHLEHRAQRTLEKQMAVHQVERDQEK